MESPARRRLPRAGAPRRRPAPPSSARPWPRRRHRARSRRSPTRRRQSPRRRRRARSRGTSRARASRSRCRRHAAASSPSPRAIPQWPIEGGRFRRRARPSVCVRRRWRGRGVRR
ncbi:MAG: hypothetical protein FJW86_13085 [Actinobacteria bacterium]|nr:hypothetical protein [Actinomycetota bacterium]